MAMNSESGSLYVGYQFPELRKEPVTKVQIAKYAGASGDFNPLHLDPEVGQAAGVGGQIAHGMLIMGFAAQAVSSWVPQKALKQLKVRFAGMTRPGDVITVSSTITDLWQENWEHVFEARIEARNQKDEAVITGYFQARAS